MKKLLLFLLLLTACTPASKPSLTGTPVSIPTTDSIPVASPRATASPKPTPTVTSIPVAKPSATTNPRANRTLTGTPVPPLVGHAWSQSEPLITFARDRGHWSPVFFILFPDDFTLLPSGDLYLRRKTEYSGSVILTTRLSRQATCYLLNSIDQAGFFDYDPSSYRGLGGMDLGTTEISVQAWRANSVHLYNFTGALWKETQYQLTGTPPHGFPTILPAIRGTYSLLDEYDAPPGALHLLKPERLGVWLLAGPSGPAGAKHYFEWPLTSHPLAGTVERMGGHLAMILTGEDAARVYNALGEAYYALVREGDKLYRVSTVLIPPGAPDSVSRPEVSLHCSPSDGWIQAP